MMMENGWFTLISNSRSTWSVLIYWNHSDTVFRRCLRSLIMSTKKIAKSPGRSSRSKFFQFRVLAARVL